MSEPDTELRYFEMDERKLVLMNLLQLEGLVESGGHAKSVIDQGLVSLNGQVETRKRCQLVMGDVVTVFGVKIVLR